jgi:hypothetical protein
MLPTVPFGKLVVEIETTVAWTGAASKRNNKMSRAILTPRTYKSK